MPFRVEIALKSGYRDAIGEGVRNAIKNSLSIGVDDVRTIKVYTVNAALTDEEKKAIAGGPVLGRHRAAVSPSTGRWPRASTGWSRSASGRA